LFNRDSLESPYLIRKSIAKIRRKKLLAARGRDDRQQLARGLLTLRSHVEKKGSTQVWYQAAESEQAVG
jgi:hypothetical protein